MSGPCVPTSISEDYPAYPYLFAMLTALAIQSIKTAGRGCVCRAPRALACACSGCSAEAFPETLTLLRGGAGAKAPPLSGVEMQSPLHGTPQEQNPLRSEPHEHEPDGKPPHSILSVLAAEFGFTAHSLIIGLTVGVVAQAELNALLVALSFHQFFEGVALGARLFDSAFSWTQDLALTLLFALSAPLGISCGIGLMSSGGINTNGETFSLVQGIFDAICAGILLHIGFDLTINEFPKDVDKVAQGRHGAVKAALMHASLWSGACAMAYIGKFL